VQKIGAIRKRYRSMVLSVTTAVALVGSMVFRWIARTSLPSAGITLRRSKSMNHRKVTLTELPICCSFFRYLKEEL